MFLMDLRVNCDFAADVLIELGLEKGVGTGKLEQLL